MTTPEDDRSGFGWAQQPGGAQLAKLIGDAFARADAPTSSTSTSDDVGPDH